MTRQENEMHLMMKRTTSLALCAALCLSTIAASADGESEIRVFKGRIELPAGSEDPTAYFVLRNGSAVTRTIVGASCECAESISILRTAVNEEGQWGSEAMPGGMPVPAGADVAFVPRGLFLRLTSARAMTEGEKLEIVLEFADGESVPFEAVAGGN